MTEVWKAYPLKPNYEVSTYGRVRNVLTGKVLVGRVRPDGYTQFFLGRGFCRLLHILVLETFVGPRPPGMLGLHGDDDKGHNHLSNLSWGTKSKNSEDFARNARKTGRAYVSDKLTADQVREIVKLVAAGNTGRAIAARYGVSSSNISAIKNVLSWTHVTGI